MKEIYWLTRLDAFLEASKTLSNVMVWVLAFAVLLWIVLTWCASVDGLTDDLKTMLKCGSKNSKVISIVSAVLLGLSYIGLMLIPSSKQAYMIYGVGGAIDYIKADSAAVEIPHKVFVAIDKFLTIEDDSVKEAKNKEQKPPKGQDKNEGSYEVLGTKGEQPASQTSATQQNAAGFKSKPGQQDNSSTQKLNISTLNNAINRLDKATDSKKIQEANELIDNINKLASKF